MEAKQETEAFERYDKVVSLLIRINDKIGLALIKELVDKCVRYIDITAVVEAYFKMLNKGVAGGEERLDIQRASQSIDFQRRTAHDALISQLIIVNRYIFSKEEIKESVPSGGIYSLNPPSSDPHSSPYRAQIGDWAKYLTEALYRRGIIRRV